MLPPGACRTSRASAKRIIRAIAFAFPSCCPPNPNMRPLPHLGVFRMYLIIECASEQFQAPAEKG